VRLSHLPGKELTVSTRPPTRTLEHDPDLDQLKRQAKELLRNYRASDPDAVTEVESYHRTATPATFALHDAQFVLARAHGFESWPKLKAAVEGVTTARFLDCVERGDVTAARLLLARRPEIVDLGRGEMRALHMAVLACDLAMTKLLVEFGADTEGGIWPKREATSPYTLARDRGHDEILAVFDAARRERGANMPSGPTDATRKLRIAWETGSEDAVLSVFEQHPELGDVCPPTGLTMLHQAAGFGAVKLVDWLLQRDASNVNKRSEEGWTPIEFAATGRMGPWLFDIDTFRRVASVLVDHGAEIGPLSAAALGRSEYFARRTKGELEAKGVLEAAVKGRQMGLLLQLLDLGLHPDERMQVGSLAEQAWSAGGPLFWAVEFNDLEMARLLLARGADPNANVWTAGSPAYRAYYGRKPEMIALMEQHGGWIDPGSAGYARQTEMARRMLAGEIDPHFAPDDFSGNSVAEQLLWGGASSRTAEIVRMALAHIDWARDDGRWFWMLWRPLPGHEDLNATEQRDAAECFGLILARSGPHHRASDYGQTMLHEVIARDHGVGVALATLLLDAGARLDVRDLLLMSTPLGWACRWGRVELVKLLLARGADPIEADGEPWTRPIAWAQRYRHHEILAILKGHAI
jgi:ankyrin repeat protein